MARRSPFQIQLTPPERETLELTGRRYTLPHREVVRAKIVLYAADGLSKRLPTGWTRRERSSANGGSGSLTSGSMAWRTAHAAGARPAFSPSWWPRLRPWRASLPAQSGLPLSRFSIPELKREVIAREIVASIGDRTLWRWLSEDAIRPWRHRSWIFPRDPEFRDTAARILDLYEGTWEGEPLVADDYVISADEKTSIQARKRLHATQAPAPGEPMRVEHEYQRTGAWAYLAAWDARQGKVFGRCERKTGLKPFGRLVRQVVSQEPYRSARRVFWILDNGSSHRGQRCVKRLTRAWPNLIPVHTPVHASWLNQVEIYFSVVQRKVLTPNDWV